MFTSLLDLAEDDDDEEPLLGLEALLLLLMALGVIEPMDLCDVANRRNLTVEVSTEKQQLPTTTAISSFSSSLSSASRNWIRSLIFGASVVLTNRVALPWLWQLMIFGWSGPGTLKWDGLR